MQLRGVLPKVAADFPVSCSARARAYRRVRLRLLRAVVSFRVRAVIAFVAVGAVACGDRSTPDDRRYLARTRQMFASEFELRPWPDIFLRRGTSREGVRLWSQPRRSTAPSFLTREVKGGCPKKGVPHKGGASVFVGQAGASCGGNVVRPAFVEALGDSTGTPRTLISGGVASRDARATAAVMRMAQLLPEGRASGLRL
jgi:hypothetical protein